MAVYLIERNLKEEEGSPLIIEGDTVTGVRNKDVTSLKIPDGIKEIGYHAFYRCNKLTSIKIPNSVKTISGAAFFECSRLVSVKIPNSVISIGNAAFAGCNALTSIIIPASVTDIKWHAFAFCENLTSVKFEGDLRKIEFGEDAFYNTPYEKEFERLMRSKGLSVKYDSWDDDEDEEDDEEEEELETAEDIIAYYDDGSGHGFDYNLDDSLLRFVEDSEEDLPFDEDEGRFTCSDEELIQAWRDYTNNSPDPNWLETNYGLSPDEAEIIEDYLEDKLISDYGSGS